MVSIELEDIGKIKVLSDKTLKSHAIAQCRGCGTQERVYLCERHSLVFCKPCLSAIEKLGDARYFRFKCPGAPQNCIYNPLFSQDG